MLFSQSSFKCCTLFHVVIKQLTDELLCHRKMSVLFFTLTINIIIILPIALWSWGRLSL